MNRDTTKISGGFTLIELLVVIAIIALLLSIIMPSIQFVKKQAEHAVCLSNLGNLSKAWYAYSNENDDKMAGGHPQLTSTWVCVPQTEDGTSRTGGSEIDEKIMRLFDILSRIYSVPFLSKRLAFYVVTWIFWVQLVLGFAFLLVLCCLENVLTGGALFEAPMNPL